MWKTQKTESCKNGHTGQREHRKVCQPFCCLLQYTTNLQQQHANGRTTLGEASVSVLEIILTTCLPLPLSCVPCASPAPLSVCPPAPDPCALHAPHTLPLPACLPQSDVGRYTTGIWTKRYLTDQLQLALAGRAAEELVFGFEELSSLNQHRLIMARQARARGGGGGSGQVC